jgi:hypothetical protein
MSAGVLHMLLPLLRPTTAVVMRELQSMLAVCPTWPTQPMAEPNDGKEKGRSQLYPFMLGCSGLHAQPAAGTSQAWLKSGRVSALCMQATTTLLICWQSPHLVARTSLSPACLLWVA